MSPDPTYPSILCYMISTEDFNYGPGVYNSVCGVTSRNKRVFVQEGELPDCWTCRAVLQDPLRRFKPRLLCQTAPASVLWAHQVLFGGSEL